ncbi:hypothetical protein CVT24_002827 [Panaeolus cyanescens]|uniref:DUF6593 domain-containing protein n=1 Tax=Panaeolus cyanescens TaxID=181874 RepID=A0A409YRG4_9AGAR|nr:hypothetical protein CVT24_002827 [Panaeolus cyanescens]
MIIHMSSNSPWHATYTTESGQVLYKCEASSPLTLSTRQFTLSRTLAPSELGWSDAITDSKSSTHLTPTASSTAVSKSSNPFITPRATTSHLDGQVDDRDNAHLYLRDQFKVVGQIEYNVWISTNSKIKIFNDISDVQGRSTGSFFRKSGFGLYGRNQSFTAPNGNEYTWKLGFTSCSLYPASTAAVKKPPPIVTFSHSYLLP